MHKKPVLMSEYGADTFEGLHMLPSFVWSEEFQCQQFSKHFQAFDQLRSEGFFIGEFVWNFADFKTEQGEWDFGSVCVEINVVISVSQPSTVSLATRRASSPETANLKLPLTF